MVWWWYPASASPLTMKHSAALTNLMPSNNKWGKPRQNKGNRAKANNNFSNVTLKNAPQRVQRSIPPSSVLVRLCGLKSFAAKALASARQLGKKTNANDYAPGFRSLCCFTNVRYHHTIGIRALTTFFLLVRGAKLPNFRYNTRCAPFHSNHMHTSFIPQEIPYD